MMNQQGKVDHSKEIIWQEAGRGENVLAKGTPASIEGSQSGEIGTWFQLKPGGPGKGAKQRVKSEVFEGEKDPYRTLKRTSKLMVPREKNQNRRINQENPSDKNTWNKGRNASSLSSMGLYRAKHRRIQRERGSKGQKHPRQRPAKGKKEGTTGRTSRAGSVLIGKLGAQSTRKGKTKKQQVGLIDEHQQKDNRA